MCELDHGGRYVLDLVVVVEPLEDEDEEDEDLVVDPEVIVDAEEELAVEEVDAVDVSTTDELGCPPDKVKNML